ncbi:prephenate dehydrogenase [Bifidobacterium actinocoloniiforme DSM 22766]|uniref:Prephenate dehydrogenase n=1 Tax=Bifidobacterium actinocoloniiforme DSM 22766 TaxID=1437605 RepID=A0A086Z0W9_9BIFI|nr:NAD(P)-binding domain-containing protein [Bifidobacterium actinocoloniiforme]KFI40169.1 prephenate dehydrogenase [Bifidobacterium actinocoloniiforme DSM 22766]
MHPLPGMAPSPILTSAHKVGVVGLGPIGLALAQRLTGRGRFVVAWDPDVQSGQSAPSDGIRMMRSLEELASGKPDVLALAVESTLLPSILTNVAPVLAQASVLIDLNRNQTQARKRVMAVGLQDQYVGAHPIIRENAVRPLDPFNDAVWALCVDRGTDYNRFLTVADMITQGLGNPLICMDDSTHDRLTAVDSQPLTVPGQAQAEPPAAETSILELDERGWQGQLQDSARRGWQVTAFTSVHQAVLSRCPLGLAQA